ncbi:MAG: hypothetical protein AVO35_09870 [Candidatus Aegiribacteria sp. MLS_C]|nr:MAG: hypothetical protein AVO35_09870 [Candidatus Aegiribacteria sp. MLS_C]
MSRFPAVPFLAVAAAFGRTIQIGDGLDYRSPMEALPEVEDGDTVLVTAGVYESDLSLELWGVRNVVLIAEEGASLVCTSMLNNVMWIVNCDSVTVSGFAAAHIQPSEDERCYGNVFALDSSDGITIRNCDISGCGAIGVYAFNCGDVFLEDNFIHGNTLWAVHFEGQGLMQEDSLVPGLTMEGNTLLNNGGRFYDTELASGISTARFAGIADEDGYMVLEFRGGPHDRIRVCYLSPSCRGPWLELFRDPEYYEGRTIEYEWREVITYFPPFDYGEEIVEVTSIVLPD